MARIREAALVEAAIDGYRDAKDKNTWANENPELLVRFHELQKYRR